MAADSTDATFWDMSEGKNLLNGTTKEVFPQPDIISMNGLKQAFIDRRVKL